MASGRGRSEFPQHPLADPELGFRSSHQPLRRRGVAAVVVSQRSQQAGNEINADGVQIHGS
jgi:predicted Fe-Mo cluster-binding NifX family protein